MKNTISILAILCAASCAYGQATVLNGTITLDPKLTHSKVSGGARVTENTEKILTRDITFGTNANQMSKWAARTVALTNSQAATFSLLGGVSNNFGDALTFSRVNFLSVVAATGNTASVTVGGADANTFAPMFNADAASQASAMPGGAVLFFAPSASGYAVETNAFNLKLLNGGTNAATVVLYIGGN